MNEKKLQIRLSSLEDFVFVFDLLKQLWKDRQLDFIAIQNVYNQALQSNKQKFIVGLVDNKIVGFCSLTIKNNLWQAGNLGHIDELIIDENYRGLSIGTKLMAEITKIAKEANCKRIELDSAFHRKEAHQFYENLGYENRAFLFSKEL